MAISEQAVHMGAKAAIASAAGSTVEDRLYNAWATVDRIRLGGNCDDTLAVVEHYLYARSLNAKYGPLYYGFFFALTAFYDLTKLLKQLGVVSWEYKEGECPQSPVSLEDWAWTFTGAQDGWYDYWGVTDVSTLPSTVPDRPRQSSAATP